MWKVALIAFVKRFAEAAARVVARRLGKKGESK